MQLLRPAEVPVTDRDRVFSYSYHHALWGTLLLIVGTCLLSYFIWRKDRWLSYLIFATVLFFLLLFRKLITARFQPTNWLVRLTDNGLFIKFRSYLNVHFPDQEPTVVFLPHSEIISARYIVEKQEVPDHDDNNRPTTTTKTNKLVELELAGDMKLFAEALLREQRYAIDGKLPFKMSSRYHHLPVRLPSDDRLHIEWAVVPNAQTFLDALTRHTLVRPTETTSKDFVNLEELGREEQESRLLELTASGDKIAAIAMARRLYAYDLTQAKEFIEELANKRRRERS